MPGQGARCRARRCRCSRRWRWPDRRRRTRATKCSIMHPPKPGEKAPEPIVVNRKDLELGKVGRDITLQDGDIVNMPVAKRFYISGFIKNPGSFVLDTGTTVGQAIILAGGLTDRGSDRRLSVIRVGERQDGRDLGQDGRQGAAERRDQSEVPVLLMCGIAGVVRRDGAIDAGPVRGARRRAGAPRSRRPRRVALARAGCGAGSHPARDHRSRPVRARSRWRRLTAVIASSSTARSTTTAICGDRSKRAASDSRPAATPKCCCGCSRATVRPRSRRSAACSRSPGGTPRRARWCSRAIASASSRCTSRRPIARSRSPRRFTRCVAAGLVDRTIDPAGVLGFLAWGTVPPSLTCVAGVESLAPGSWMRWSQDGGCARQTFADVAGRVRAGGLGLLGGRAARASGRRGAAERGRAPGRRRAGRCVSLGRHRLVGDSVGRVRRGRRRPQHLHRPVRRSIVRARVREAGRVHVRRDASRAASSIRRASSAISRAFSRASISRRSTR